MKKFLFLQLLIPMALIAQPQFEKHYGAGGNYDFAFAGDKTSDGGSITTGYTQNNLDVDLLTLIKTDAFGDTIWAKTSDWGNSYGFSVKQTNDNGYIVCGYSGDGAIGTSMLIIRTDSMGDISWAKKIGPVFKQGFSIAPTSDGGFIAAGSTKDSSAPAENAYLVRLDSAGNIIWSHSYGSGNAEKLFSVQETSDGNIIAAGFSQPNDGSGEGADAYLIKTNYNGDLLWSNTIGNVPNDYGYSVQETPDGNYVLLGYSRVNGLGDYDVFLTKTDTDGTILWSKVYPYTGDQAAFSLSKTMSNGLFITGSTTNGILYLKTDDSGNVAWARSRTYAVENNAAYSGAELSNGDYYVYGSVFGINVDPLGSSDVFVIHTDSLGNTGCGDVALSLASTSVSFSNTLFVPDSSYVADTGGIAEESSHGFTNGTYEMSFCPGSSGQTISGVNVLCPNSTGIAYSINDQTATDYLWNLSSGMSIESGQSTNSINVGTDSSFTSGTVTVTVTTSSGSYVAYLNVSAFPDVPGAIGGNSIGLCRTQENYVIASIPGATSYTWTAPAGTTILSGQGSTTILLESDSTFVSGTLLVAANSDCGTGAQQGLFLKASPPAVETISGPADNLCPASIATATYIASPVVGATSYTWVAPAGASIVSDQGLDSVVIAFDSTFAGGMLLVYANNECATSDSTQLQLNSTPLISYTYGQSTDLCSYINSTVSYSAFPDVPGVTYNWTAPAGATIVDGQGTPYINVAFDSTFTSGDLVLLPSNSCGDGNPVTLSLYSVPLPVDSIIGETTDICTYTSTYSYLVAGADGSGSYIWTAPEGTTIIFGQGTDYIEIHVDSTFAGGILTVAELNGCGTGQADSLFIQAPPILAMPGPISGPVTGLCPSGISSAGYSVEPAQFVVNYNWVVPTGVTIQYGQGTDSVFVVFDSTFTSGSLSVTANDECGHTTSARTLLLGSVLAKPGAVSGSSSVCENQTGLIYSISAVSGASSYVWTVPTGASLVSGQGSTSVTVDMGTSSGNIHVVAINDCGESPVRNKHVHVHDCHSPLPDAIAEDNTLQLIVYPNPTDGLFTIELPDAGSAYELSITNVLGEEVYKSQVSGSKTSVDLKKETQGIYIVRISGNGMNWYRKISKQ